jgi:hypothetical protein
MSVHLLVRLHEVSSAYITPRDIIDMEFGPRCCCVFLAIASLLGCGESSYEPTPGNLVGEFSGRAGEDFRTYDLFLAVDEVADSVRGSWSLAFLTTCTTHDGPFSGTLNGDQLKLRLRPDEGSEATFDLTARVLPGDTVLSGNLTVVAIGSGPLCFEDFASLRLHQREVDGLPVGR